jgi:type VI secretion system protein ImpM
MTLSADRVRLFGKLPAHGDFVARGFDAGGQAAVDAWLSASLADARAALDGFEAAYDVAPAWRYAAPETGGALAASVDAVGRRFPILLLVEGAAAAACEALLHRALAEGWDVEALSKAAFGLPIAQDRARGWWVEDAAGTVVATCSSERPAGLIRAMLSIEEGVPG